MSTFTKTALEKTFIDLLNERPLDQITVTDIVNRCGVNRNTFYYYFEDMYALVDDMFRAQTQALLDDYPVESLDSLKSGFLAGTKFMRDNKALIFHLYNSVSRSRLEEYVYDMAEKTVDRFIRAQAKGLDVSEHDIKTLTSLYTSGFEGVALSWMRNGMADDPEVYIDDMDRLLHGMTAQILKRAADGKHREGEKAQESKKDGPRKA